MQPAAMSSAQGPGYNTQFQNGFPPALAQQNGYPPHPSQSQPQPPIMISPPLNSSLPLPQMRPQQSPYSNMHQPLPPNQAYSANGNGNSNANGYAYTPNGNGQPEFAPYPNPNVSGMQPNRPYPRNNYQTQGGAYPHQNGPFIQNHQQHRHQDQVNPYNNHNQYYNNASYGPGGGGPGPSTFQNGYGQHQSSHPGGNYNNYYQHPHPQQYPGASGTGSSPLPPPMNLPDGNMPYPSQPSYIPNGYTGHRYGNGPHSGTGHGQQPYYNQYPADHPYAHGNGVGYIPQHQSGPMPPYGYGYGYDNSFFPPPLQPAARPPPQSNGLAKSLNPTAQGFQYNPIATAAVPPPPDTGQAQVNGDRTPRGRAGAGPDENTPMFATLAPTPHDQAPAQSSSPSATNSLPNGHAEPHTNGGQLPLAVQPKVGGEVETPQSATLGGAAESVGALGLTQMDVAPVEPTAPEVSTPLSQSTQSVQSIPTPLSTEAPQSILTENATPTKSTPATTTAEVTPTKTTPSRESSMGADLIEHNTPGAAPISLLGVSTIKPAASPPKRRLTRRRSKDKGEKQVQAEPTTVDPFTLRLVSSTPDPKTFKGNSFARSQSYRIPSIVRTAIVKQARWSKPAKKQGATSRMRPGPTTAVSFGKKAPSLPKPSARLIFGSLIDGAAIASSSAKGSTTWTAKPKPGVETTKPTEKAVRRSGLISYAAMLGPANDSPSTWISGPSSAVQSPSKSIASLPAQEEDSTTPRSVAASLPPQASSSPAKPAPKAPINYASAVSTGRSMTRQEELMQLITVGPSGRYAGNNIVPRGLINTGNMCFANTILQSVLYCAPMAQFIDSLTKLLAADLTMRTPLLESFISLKGEFAPTSTKQVTAGKTQDAQQDAFVPEFVYEAMKISSRFDRMRRGTQEDAEEYLGFALDTLHEELLYLQSRNAPNNRSSTSRITATSREDGQIDRPVSPTDGWVEVGPKQKTTAIRSVDTQESAISHIFSGYFRNTLNVPGVKPSHSLEQFTPLQLDVQSPSVHSIIDALKNISAPEVVPDVWSPARNSNVDALKQVYVETFPQVLILHLKRFVYDSRAQKASKEFKPVAYGTELVVPVEMVSPAKRAAGPVRFKLVGVVYHHGKSASGGHYTNCALRPDGKAWLHFDDETVTTVPVEDVIVSKEEVDKGHVGQVGGREKCAYLLFYQRVRA